MGGVVPETPIHAFAATPACLALKPQPSLRPSRLDVDLGGSIAFVIRDVVTPDEARTLDGLLRGRRLGDER